jgi:hypothetical protein
MKYYDISEWQRYGILEVDSISEPPFKYRDLLCVSVRIKDCTQLRVVDKEVFVDRAQAIAIVKEKASQAALRYARIAALWQHYADTGEIPDGLSAKTKPAAPSRTATRVSDLWEDDG